MQSKLIQQKIEDLKFKNVVLEDIKQTTSEHSKDVNQFVSEVSDLHKLVMKKYLK